MTAKKKSTAKNAKPKAAEKPAEETTENVDSAESKAESKEAAEATAEETAASETESEADTATDNDAGVKSPKTTECVALVDYEPSKLSVGKVYSLDVDKAAELKKRGIVDDDEKAVASRIELMEVEAEDEEQAL